MLRHRYRALVSAGLAATTVALAASPAAANAGGPLPDTGSSVQWWLIIAIAVLVLGGGLYAFSRWSSKRGSK